ncbi:MULTISPECIES: TetR/AcrR family transcriptional regulator [Marinobacter]|jgi:AcrR family transcriptional regulator|uniref:TetR/AcrR family transcriptional regulator n=1 Tax=Marinobacter TaxID=2742 RepID=UPI000A9A3547|nr:MULTISPECIES: TetR/AcrR family transcriptional regulator [unclassified Marinobacter]
MTTEANIHASDSKASAAGGRVSIHRRKNSRFWQCQCSVDGKIHRVSSRTEDLAEAQRFATLWFVKLVEASESSDLPAELANGSAELPTGSNLPFSVPMPNDKSDRIVSAAVLLVAENGFRNAQMSGIAEKSGLALSTLYRYFPSKNELMRKVVARVAGREVNAAAGASMSEGTPIMRLEISVRTFAERAVRGWRLAHALVAEPVDADIEMERLRYRRRLERVYETLIREGMNEGTIIEQDPEVSAGCIVGALFEGLVGPLALQAELSEKERMKRAERIVTFCIRGVVGVGST